MCVQIRDQGEQSYRMQGPCEGSRGEAVPRLPHALLAKTFRRVSVRAAALAEEAAGSSPFSPGQLFPSFPAGHRAQIHRPGRDAPLGARRGRAGGAAPRGAGQRGEGLGDRGAGAPPPP